MMVHFIISSYTYKVVLLLLVCIKEPVSDRLQSGSDTDTNNAPTKPLRPFDVVVVLLLLLLFQSVYYYRSSTSSWIQKINKNRKKRNKKQGSGFRR
jgi:hypothetical protein